MTSVINAERLVSTFTELCAIDAEPTRERAMADRLTALLNDLGFVVTEDDAGVKLGGTEAICTQPWRGPAPAGEVVGSGFQDDKIEFKMRANRPPLPYALPATKKLKPIFVT